MAQNNVMGSLTMCRRAGKLQLGMDTMKDSCANKTAKIVLVANDISPKTLKEVKYVCAKHKIELYDLEVDMNEVGYNLGKRVGIVAICDNGFAKKIKTILKKIENDTVITSDWM